MMFFLLFFFVKETPLYTVRNDNLPHCFLGHAPFWRKFKLVISNCLTNPGGRPKSNNDSVIVDCLIRFNSFKNGIKENVIIYCAKITASTIKYQSEAMVANSHKT